MSKITNDLLKIGLVVGIGYIAYKGIRKDFFPSLGKTPVDPQLQADTAAALSLEQTRILPNGSIIQVPYVESQLSAITGEEQVLIQKYAEIPGREESGVAVAGLTPQQFADLPENDQRALRTGQFSVTEEGLLITGTDRLISLIPGGILSGFDKLKSSFSTSPLFTQALRTTAQIIAPVPYTIYSLADKLRGFFPSAAAPDPDLKTATQEVSVKYAAPRETENKILTAIKEPVSGSTTRTPDPRFSGDPATMLKYARGF